MQAPQTPIDIKIEMGSDKNNQNLLNIDLDFTDNGQYVKQFLDEKKLPQEFGNHLVFMFDLYSEQGREKDAFQYFASDKGKAPLQILFNNRPDQTNQIIKFQLQQHEGFVRIVYKIATPPENSGTVFATEILEVFKAHQVQLQSHLSWQLKGTISHNNKNRTNVIVDYSKFEFISNAFCSQKFFNCISTFEEIKNNCEYYLNHPFFALVKKSKVAKLHLKMDPFRKVSKYYNQVSQMQKDPKEKTIKYVNKGIFREKANAVMIFRNQYMVKINGKYQSEDAFQRLLKVYSKFFEKLLQATFYQDD